ncbi:HPF/RaiA family ribosome-associated protein [Telluribacter sp.]|jgi:putative sigma-54 modulation protein|uniref:HPF/RaiA family ribosome-associated protein n=1 Tax=Telluribacter sp. TaxID=1978767 RepID=UPI002E12F057|nr:HPF/RaiA family ribosome-associated protein [Telluribacter sp.]
MNRIEQLEHIKLDIRTVDVEPDAETINKVRNELKKLMRLYGSIVGADVFLKEISQSRKNNKLARMRVGIPGQDLIAEASSSSWATALSMVSEMLCHQILNRYRK